MYIFKGDRSFLYLSLALPYLFHGFYNYLEFPISMIIIIILTITSLRLHNKLKNLQKSKRFEKEKKIIK